MAKTKKEALLEVLRKPITAEGMCRGNFTITIVNQNMHHPERISWEKMDNLYKADFIDAVYNDDLVNTKATFIQIVGWDSY